jgi:hypothetical protein
MRLQATSSNVSYPLFTTGAWSVSKCLYEIEGQPYGAKRLVYCSDDAWAMVGIQQQIATFDFVADNDRIAAEKLQVNGVLDN